jgi:phytol kinase
MHNGIAAVLTFFICVTWLKFTEILVKKNLATSATVRKWVHIGTGPIFLLCWYLFGLDFVSSLYAAFVPGVITLRFALIGLGILKDEETVKSMSRSGSAHELLFGPLAYGIIFILSTIIYWKTSVVGVTALMLLCFGDGFAGLIGQRYGRMKLPHNNNKSWIGTISFILSAFIGTIFYVKLFAYFGWLKIPASFFSQLSIVVIVCALVESLPLRDWDNFAVFFTAVFLYKLLGV